MNVLVGVSGRSAGIRYEFESALVLGRSSGVDVQLWDDAASRKHARLYQEGADVWLEDLGSQNGTLLNGRRLERPTRLSPEDVVIIGAQTFVFAPRFECLPGGDGVVIRPDLPLTFTAKSADESSVLGNIVSEALAKAEQGGGAAIQAALEQIKRHFGAERALVLGRFENRTRVLAAVGQGPVVVSRTVMEKVLEQRQALVSADATGELALGGGYSLAAGEIRSLLAAPLLAGQKILGVLHVDRRQRGAYGPSDLSPFLAAAQAMALVVAAAEGFDAQKKQRRYENRIETPEIVAESPAMHQLLSDASRIAQSSATVLINGETGTGKEVLAHYLHAQGPRAKGPFVAVNCGALPEQLQEAELFGHEAGAYTGAGAARPGLFEAADGGTLFLDEVAECSPATQVKLLRALQERVIFRLGSPQGRAVDVRVIAASGRPLRDLVGLGRFREDLYFRLAVVELTTPPLRARPADVAPLVQHFAARHCQQNGLPPRSFDPEVLRVLEQHRWPGNVRELGNLVERLVLLADRPNIGLKDLPIEFLAGGDIAEAAITAGETMAEATLRLERALIIRVMARTGGVKTAAAEALGISRVTLDAKIKNLGIDWSKQIK